MTLCMANVITAHDDLELPDAVVAVTQ